MYRSRSSRSGEVFSRIVLPLVLFVAVVGGIAWMTQYLPSGGGKSKISPDVGSDDPFRLNFKVTEAVFDPKDPAYGLEVEADEKCHYDFPFQNESSQELELGLKFKNCNCTHIDFQVGDQPFKAIAPSEKEGVIVGAGTSGVVRFNWTGNKTPGPPQRLKGELWCQHKGVAKTRRFQTLEAKYVVVPPLMFQPDKQALGAVSDRMIHFTCWSATRKHVKLTPDKDIHPCIVYDIKPMTEKEMQDLRDGMKQETKSRVLSAFHVNVAIYQEKDGKYLDQGYLDHKAKLHLQDDSNSEPIDVTGPAITGTVAGDVTVGTAEDNGKFNLSFTSGEDIKRSMTLTADSNVVLSLVAGPQGQYPDAKTMKVTLTKNEADSTPDRTSWKLEIGTKDYTLRGPVPENSFIMVQQTSPSRGIRRIRIPVVGTVTVQR